MTPYQTLHTAIETLLSGPTESDQFAKATALLEPEGFVQAGCYRIAIETMFLAAIAAEDPYLTRNDPETVRSSAAKRTAPAVLALMRPDLKSDEPLPKNDRTALDNGQGAFITELAAFVQSQTKEGSDLCAHILRALLDPVLGDLRWSPPVCKARRLAQERELDVHAIGEALLALGVSSEGL
jgi:hypothetical protein